MHRGPQGRGTSPQDLSLVGIQMAAQRVLAPRTGAADRLQRIEQSRGRRGPVARQFLAEPHEPLAQDLERGHGRLHPGQVITHQPCRIDARVEADGDGVQRQPETAQRQHLIETYEIVLGVFPVSSRGAL